MTKKKGNSGGKKQAELSAMEGPGVAKPSFPAVDKASETYVAARDARMELPRKEVEAKKELRRAMDSAKVTDYEYDAEEGVRRIVTVPPPKDEADAVKVKTVRDGEVEV